ncbi:FAD:protein FMN transferase [Aquibacillus koreensis]|uniref:FAD:protein FMN transferase n=1 Tax=Aquibacillus koreensis TaxID=279446 RepID=A0A9X3WMF5_9BACI|nr:FAD:protein FMN transferase [Aquibacillus koreensis]MCT2534298.1 FAD:protein FMN transferase [Aquibacillus koreensis]MDC3422375.1 FAD:protein FMN transferase [Aquibacillus koreensis]
MKRWILYTCILTLIIMTGCGQAAEQTTKLTNNPYKETAFLMGTVVTIKVYDEDKEDVLDLAFDRMHALADQITSEEEAASEVDKINQNAGVEPVSVSEDLFTLIDKGKTYSAKAEGTFDISIGPLTSLWHIGFPDARKPEQTEIDKVLPLVDYKNIELNEEEQSVFLKREGMKLDLGAIAKGFIADEIVQVLEENEVETAIIDLGGNIFVMGDHPEGKAWTVGIQNPFSARGETVGTVKVTNKSIVTSGIYERYLEQDGVKYHHILNSKDGYPIMNDIAGISIISEKSIDGDALSTSVFSKGIKEGMAYIEEFDGVEAVFVSNDKEVYLTSGLEQVFTITNDEFEISSLKK